MSLRLARMTEKVGLHFVKRIARDAHDDQVDKQGRDYYEHHLVPVAESLAHLGEHAVMAGYLHDIVEDHGDLYSLDRLRALGIPEPVVRAVDSVSRRPGESYFDLIDRACADPLGVHVKIADNEHNILSNPGLAVMDEAHAQTLLAGRYLPARDRLIAARTRFEGRPTPPAITSSLGGDDPTT